MTAAPALPAPEQPAAPLATRTGSLPVSNELWQHLAGETLTSDRRTRETICAKLPQLLIIARRMVAPRERADAAIETLIAPLLSLPATARGQVAGAAALAGYRIGLQDMSNTLITEAVTRALRDPDRRFRPSPNELRAYVADELASIRRRLTNLLLIAHDQAAFLPPPPRADDAAEREAVRAQMEQLAERIGARTEQRQPSPLPGVQQADGPLVETLMSALGIDRDAAEARRAAILAGRANGDVKLGAEKCDG